MSEQGQKQRKHRKSKRHEVSLLVEFRFEIIIGFLFLLGVFLLYEDMEVKTVVFQGILSVIHGFNLWLSNLLSNILGIADYVETSDIVGTFFILLALFLLLHRARHKALARFAELSECPECEGDLIHIHRTLTHRIISKIFRLKIRHMKCKSCEFEGLRIRKLDTR